LVANKTDKKQGFQISDAEIDLFVKNNPLIVMWKKSSILERDKIFELKMCAVKLAYTDKLTHLVNDKEPLRSFDDQNDDSFDIYKTSCSGENC